MRAMISLINKVEGAGDNPDTFTVTEMVSDYKVTKQSAVSGNEISHYNAMMFLLPFGDYQISQCDHIVIGSVSAEITSASLNDVLEASDSFEIRTIDEVEKKCGVNYQYKVVGV